MPSLDETAPTTQEQRNRSQSPRVPRRIANVRRQTATTAAGAARYVNEGTHHFYKGVKKTPDYKKKDPTDPDDCEKGMIGGGEGFRERPRNEIKKEQQKEAEEAAAHQNDDEETAVGGDTPNRTPDRTPRASVDFAEKEKSGQVAQEKEKLQQMDEAAKKNGDYDFPVTNTSKKADPRAEGKEIMVLSFREGDPEDPYNWGRGYKWYTTMLLCCMTLFIGLATTSYSSSIGSMVEQLGVSTEVGEVGLTTFNCVCAVAPLVIGPVTEVLGRRWIYVVSFALFTLTFLLLAIKNNIAQVLIGRAILGFFGSVGTILVGGTFGDIWKPIDRTIPTACFSFVAIFGTVAAPIYAGFVDQALGPWWQEWIQMIQNGVLLVVLALTLKETRGDAKLSARAKHLRQVTGDDRYVAEIDLEAANVGELLAQSCKKSVNLLATEPVLLAFGIWIAFAWFVTFVFLSVIPITFTEKKGWSEGISGLPYIGLCLGVTFAFALNFLQDARYKKLYKASGGKNIPEARLYLAMALGWTLPGGLFIYSFTQYQYLHWIGPVIGLVLIGMGIFAIFNSVYDYTSDAYGDQASSGIAGQGLLRNTLAGVGPLFATQMFHNMGSQYAGLLLALLGTLLTPIPFVLVRWGPSLRKKSKVASQYTD